MTCEDSRSAATRTHIGPHSHIRTIPPDERLSLSGMKPCRSAITLLAVTALPALAACSASVSVGDNGFDKAAFEKSAVTEINKDYAETGRSVSTYTCDYPDGEIEAGANFTCTADIDGAKVHTDIAVTDDDGGYKLTTEELLFDMPSVARQLAQPVADQLGGNINVNCGTDVKALVAGSTFECRVTDRDSGAVSTLTYYVTANSANDRWEVR